MPQVNLSDVQRAADKKHGDFKVFLEDDTLIFLNPLRLEKDKRKAIAALNTDEFYAEGGPGADFDKWDMYREIFKLTAKRDEHFTKLDGALGDDPAMWEELFNALNEVTEMGEVSPSES